MKASPPTLYLGLDGPLLLPTGQLDRLLHASVAAYAKPFLHWATGRFRVRWLSRRSPRDAFYLATLLALPEDAVPVAGFRNSRCEAIPAGENFFWVDGPLSSDETAWLQARGPARFLAVDARVGVTPGHKRALEELILKGEQR